MNGSRPYQNSNQEFERIAQSAKRNGGATLIYPGLRPAGSGYVVAMACPFLCCRDLQSHDICDFMQRFDQQLTSSGAFGLWLNDHGDWVLTCSRLFVDYLAAIQFGQQHRQRFIWNLDYGIASPII